MRPWLLRLFIVAVVAIDYFTPDIGFIGGLLDRANAQAANGAVTVTNSSAAAITIPGGATYLSIDNESSSSAIACAFAGATAALNTAGSYTIGAGQTRVWQFQPAGGLLPPGALNCISAGASTPATIETH